MKNTLEFIMAGSEVKRYHTVTTLREETVGHHSHGVAMLCMVLTDYKASAQLLESALMHDLAEAVTGDIPSPAKREYGIGDQVSALEFRLLRDAGLPVYALNQTEERILKLADIAQGALFCLREISMGNSKMRIVLDRYMAYADSMVLVGRERELFDTIKEKM